MDEGDSGIIERLLNEDEEFRRLYEQHRVYEKRLDKLNSRLSLTSEEGLEKKRIQKMKLAGKDRLERMISRYR